MTGSLEARISYLKEVPLFQDVREKPVAMEALARMMHEKTYEPSATILHEGQQGSDMYFLLEGDASVHKSTSEGDQYKVAIIHGTQHAFFGEGGLLDSDARSATIKADSRCRCLVLQRAAFEEFGVRHPEWALPVTLRIARAVMTRVRKSNHDLMLLYHALVAEIRGT